MSTKDDELVLTIPAEALHPYSSMEGFAMFSPNEAGRIASSNLLRIAESGRFMRRGDVENEPKFKQIITQIALIAENQILVHDIPTTGGEERLHNLSPIFLGGHINQSDGNNVLAAAMREFGEEAGYEFDVITEFVGWVNRNDTMVNAVHIGMVFVFQGPRAIIKPTKDNGVGGLRFVSWDEAVALIPSMTPWSRVAVQLLRESYEHKH